MTRWARWAVGIEREKVNWVLGAGIADFFTSLDHGWVGTFLERRIAGERVLRLVGKWLSAGVMEDGVWAASDQAAPQGASASPLLANVYLPTSWTCGSRNGDAATRAGT